MEALWCFISFLFVSKQLQVFSAMRWLVLMVKRFIGLGWQEGPETTGPPWHFSHLSLVFLLRYWRSWSLTLCNSPWLIFPLLLFMRFSKKQLDEKEATKSKQLLHTNYDAISSDFFILAIVFDPMIEKNQFVEVLLFSHDCKVLSVAGWHLRAIWDLQAPMQTKWNRRQDCCQSTFRELVSIQIMRLLITLHYGEASLDSTWHLFLYV